MYNVQLYICHEAEKQWENGWTPSAPKYQTNLLLSV